MVNSNQNVTPFKVIMADPPWPYNQRLGRGKRAGQLARGGLPYRSMTVEDIAALPVGNVVAKDCIMWLWTTNTHLPQALQCVEAWGFQYITLVTWAKNQIGLGYWLRGKTEHCIMAIRGRPRSKMAGPHGATGAAWSTLITAPKGQHSVKPQAFYDMAEAIGEEPRLELFARVPRFGWTCVGYESSGQSVEEFLRQVQDRLGTRVADGSTNSWTNSMTLPRE